MTPPDDSRMVTMPEPLKATPTKQSEPKYPKLSGDSKEKFLKDWKKELTSPASTSQKTQKA